MAITTQSVLAELNKTNARWAATDTPQSSLSDEYLRRLLGAVPSPEALAMAAAPPQATFPAFAPAVDWRNVGGQNHVTPVKDQGGCGACVSFSCCGMIESMAHIELGQSLDLSEADSHFCSSHGANCSGWWPDQCLDQVIARGICDDGRFKYTSAFPGGDIWSGPPQCHLAPDRNQHAVTIGSRLALTDPVAAKNHLTAIGPVAGCFTVFEDFFHYSTGVYHHVTGSAAGGHCVLVIGYSEAEQCWICKNSWNTSWGDNGFFKIAYTDLIFNGQFFPMYGAQTVTVP